MAPLSSLLSSCFYFLPLPLSLTVLLLFSPFSPSLFISGSATGPFLCWVFGCSVCCVIASKIGVTNSYIAELWGLREGLKIAIDRDFNKLVIESDSYAMVQVLNRDDESRPETDTLIADCYSLMRKIEEVELIHVYREGNFCADFLANLGQNGEWGTTILNHPPEGIQDFLNRDARNIAIRRIR